MGWSFSIASEVLLSALDTVRPAVMPSHDTACMVLLRDGEMEACRDDFRITVKAPQLKVSEPLLLNHARLVAALRECSGDVKVARSATASTVTVSGSGGHWRLNAAGVDSWPTLPPRRQRATPVCRLPADQLARCLSSVIDAASDTGGEWRPAMEGVRIEVLDGTVSFVAMDGRRLYVSRAEVDQAVDDGAISVSLAAARVMLSLAAGADSSSVQIVREATRVGWSVGGVTVAAPLLAGNYVRWQRAIPDRQHAPMSVDASELLAAVRRAEVVTSKDSRAISVRFDGKRVVLAARSTEYGSAEVACPAVGAKLEAVLHLDPRHVRQWLSHIDAGGVVDVDAGNGMTAVILRHEDSTAVVMPMSAAAMAGGDE